MSEQHIKSMGGDRLTQSLSLIGIKLPSYFWAECCAGGLGSEQRLAIVCAPGQGRWAGTALPLAEGTRLHRACLQNGTHKLKRDLCCVCLSKATDQIWAPHSAIQTLRWNFWWCLLCTGQSLGLNLQVALSNTSVGDWVLYIFTRTAFEDSCSNLSKV